MSLQLPLLESRTTWIRVDRDHRDARALADRHYSRQTVGAHDFMPPGRTLVLLTVCGRAVWGCVENLDPAGGLRWRCTIFRNEGAGLSSMLIAEATQETMRAWQGHLPNTRLSTEVDPLRTRHKRDPGRCFRRAGWTVRGLRRSLLILDAPGEVERVP